MTKFSAFVLIVFLRIIYHPSNTPKDISPFAGQTPIPVSTTFIKPVKPVSNNGIISDQHLMKMNDEKKLTDKFEVEKSTPGTSMTGALLAFSFIKNRNAYDMNEDMNGDKKIITTSN